ncbi:MAG TPA: hypothetical protein VJN44_18865 [Roseateles sp.]|nr:hypothetical protein [Roseateles sp.]
MPLTPSRLCASLLGALLALPAPADADAPALAGLDAAQRRVVHQFLARQRDPDEPRARATADQARAADLDGDGWAELLLLWSRPYGNSLSTRLSVLLPPVPDARRGWRLAGSQTVPGINATLTVKPPLIRLDSAVEKPGDARCCPSGKAVQQLRLSGGRLLEVRMPRVGAHSLSGEPLMRQHFTHIPGALALALALVLPTPPALATPLIVSISNQPDYLDTSLNAAELAQVLGFTGLRIDADERVRITESIDLSSSPEYGIAFGQLVLHAPTIDLLGQVLVSGLGFATWHSLNLNADVVNLGGRVIGTAGSSTLSSGPGVTEAFTSWVPPPARSTGLVNVLSALALIDQALLLVGSGGSTRVGAGSYAEAITAASLGGLVLEQQALVAMRAGTLAGVELDAGSVFDWWGGLIDGGATDLLIGADAVAGVHGRDFALNGVVLGAGHHQLLQQGGLLTGWLDDGSRIEVQIDSRGRLDLFNAAETAQPLQEPASLAPALAGLQLMFLARRSATGGISPLSPGRRST